MITFHDKILSLGYAAKEFQSLRQQIGKGRYESRLRAKAESHVTEIEGLIDKVNADISLMTAIQKQKRGKTQQRNQGYSRHGKSDIFQQARSAHAAQQNQARGDAR